MTPTHVERSLTVDGHDVVDRSMLRTRSEETLFTNLGVSRLSDPPLDPASDGGEILSSNFNFLEFYL